MNRSAARINVTEGDLIEDWPVVKEKKVRFARYSTFRSYASSTPSCMFYNKKERRCFQAQAVKEVHRIKGLIKIYAINALEAGSTVTAGDAIKHLIKHGYLKVDELIGLEKWICEDLTGQDNRSQRHVQTIVKAQEQMKKHGELDADTLAKIASANSSKDVRKAVRKAMLAM
jgi:hypothetical protein